MIQYQSTRGSKNIKTAAQAVIQGIAEDKGLYVPDQIPALPKKIEELVGKPYKEVAYRSGNARRRSGLPGTVPRQNGCVQGHGPVHPAVPADDGYEERKRR